MVKSVPGPGNYTFESHTEKGPKYTLGAKRHDGTPKPVDVNGPGAYNPDFTVTKKKLAMTKIGTSKRPQLDAAIGAAIKNPGPGNYNIDSYSGRDTPK